VTAFLSFLVDTHWRRLCQWRLLSCRRSYSGIPNCSYLALLPFQMDLVRTFRLPGTLFHCRQSHYWPGQALRVPGVSGSKISRQSAHEGGKVVSPTHQLLLPLRKYSRYSFLLGTAVTQWLSCCATNWKVGGSIPTGITGIFH